MPQAIDYAALAKQAGAISSVPAQNGGAVDYAALAKQAGAVSSDPPPAAPQSWVQRIFAPRDPMSMPGAQRPTGEMPGSFEGHPENVGEYVPATVGQVIQGGANIGRGKVSRGAHQIISGGLNAAMPALPFLAAAAPLSTLATLGTGTAGQYVAQKGAEALGASPDQAELAGDVGGLAAGYGSAKLAGAVSSRFKAPLGDTVTKPRGTIPPENYSPAELKAYADQNGISINAAQATEHVGARNLQSAGERASVGGTAIKRQIATSQGQLETHVNKLAETFSPNTPDVASTGSALQDSVQSALDTELARSEQNYGDVDKAAQGAAVDMGPVKQTAQRVLADSQILRQSGLDPRTATRILSGIDNVADRATFSDAQKVRSALLDVSRSPELAISNTAQGMLKQVIGATDGAMMTAAQGKPGLESVFRSANEHWSQIQDDFNSPRSPLSQIISEPDPTNIVQKIAQRGQTGGSTFKAGLLDDYGIDKGPVKAAILRDLFNRNFSLRGRTLGGYSDDFLSSVYTPAELDEVYKTGAIARSLGLNTNPSGTAAVSSAIQDVRNPLWSLAPKAGAARLTKSPGFNQRLMTPAPARTPSNLPVVGMAASTLGAASANQQNDDVVQQILADPAGSTIRANPLFAPLIYPAFLKASPWHDPSLRARQR